MIQVVAGWEAFTRRRLDSEPVDLFLSGSQSEEGAQRHRWQFAGQYARRLSLYWRRDIPPEAKITTVIFA